MRRRPVAVLPPLAGRACSPAARSGPTTSGPKCRAPTAFQYATADAVATARYAVVAAVRRPGAGRPDRRGAGAQQQHRHRHRQRRAGCGGADRRPARSSSRRSATARAPGASAHASRPSRRNCPTTRTRPTPTRPRCRPAGKSTCGAASAASPRRRWPTCWPPSEARRGVVLSLVASVANSYLQLRGLDAQLEVALQTLDTYRRIGRPVQAAVRVRPGVADERGAGRSRSTSPRRRRSR